MTKSGRRFENRTACVTGSAVGIGRAAALRMAEEGAKLVLMDIDGEKLEKVRLETGLAEEDVLTLRCDVSDEGQVKAAAEKAIARFGKVDILVNNAALWRCWAPFTDVKTEEWKRFFDVNVMGCVYCIQAFLPGMLERGYGRIINVGSVAGVYGNANMTHYSATKGAVIAMTKALAKEVTGKGVLVNCVSPGSVSPSENPDIDSYVPSDLAFIGRTGTDRENADLICFLAGDEAGYISGQNIQIDGCRRKQ